MGYRKFLNSHGLRLKYQDGDRRSTALKSYVDRDGRAAYIYLQHHHDIFYVIVYGKGVHLGYFKREAQVLKERLEEFGFYVVTHIFVD